MVEISLLFNYFNIKYLVVIKIVCIFAILLIKKITKMSKEYKLGQIVTINGTKCSVIKSDDDCEGCILNNQAARVVFPVPGPP